MKFAEKNRHVLAKIRTPIASPNHKTEIILTTPITVTLRNSNVNVVPTYLSESLTVNNRLKSVSAYAVSVFENVLS